VQAYSEGNNIQAEVRNCSFNMHFVEWLWTLLDTHSRLAIACCCTEYYGQVAERWKHVVIPESISMTDNKLMQIMIVAQSIQSLTIQFPVDEEEDNAAEAMMRRILGQFTDEGPQSESEDKNKKKTKRDAVDYPAHIINPSYLEQLKQIEKVDFKSCSSDSYQSFISPFILQLPRFIAIKTLGLPILSTIRHHSLEVLDIRQLQVGFDGMNVHLGADLVGITHFKKQLPRIRRLYCDELYLFIGEDIYIDHEKSGKQYWVVMRKWCHDVNIQILFRNPIIPIMLMPHDKKTPPLITEDWENIKEWIQDRLEDFFVKI